MADQNSSLESNYHAPVMGLVSVSGRPGGQQGRQEETSQVGFSMKSLRLWRTWNLVPGFMKIEIDKLAKKLYYCKFLVYAAIG